jgi:ADP-heptose:LPS heptosyltransferase
VCDSAGGAAVNVAGKDNLETLPAILARLSVLVSGDTGPLHIAALMGTRTLSLFGPTDPRRTAPRGQAHALLRRDLACSPCFKRVCPLSHHDCMNGISPEEVAGEVERILNSAMDAWPTEARAES